MIKVVEVADDILGFELSGIVTAEDYEKVLIPAIEKKLTISKRVKILYHVREDFDSYEFKALLDDVKVGFDFFENLEKIAIVSDVEWIVNGVKIFAFILPGTVKTFTNSELKKAKEWLMQKETLYVNLRVTLQESKKMVILEPNLELNKDDFLYAKSLIDPFIEKVGKLNGIIIYMKDFPAWDSFSSFLTHMKFIKDHHKKIKKLAFVTDSFVGEMGEKVGSHFVNAEVKNFSYDALDKAQEWILS